MKLVRDTWPIVVIVATIAGAAWTAAWNVRYFLRAEIRDFMIAVGAAAALFAAFQAWSNGREIARLSGIAEIVTTHVNAAGLHR